jgi:hypothetical protein
VPCPTPPETSHRRSVQAALAGQASAAGAAQRGLGLLGTDELARTTSRADLGVAEAGMDSVTRLCALPVEQVPEVAHLR